MAHTQKNLPLCFTKSSNFKLQSHHNFNIDLFLSTNFFGISPSILRDGVDQAYVVHFISFMLALQMRHRLQTHLQSSSNSDRSRGIKHDVGVLVIRSGIGRLTRAADLGAKGVSVAILERHFIPGGSSGNFHRNARIILSIK